MATLENRLYLGREVAGLQSPPIRHAYMRALCQYYHHKKPSLKPVRILEIGSWVGTSTITWYQGLKKYFEQFEILCIDAWMPYFDTQKNQGEQYALMNQLAQEGNALEIFKHNIAVMNMTAHVHYQQGLSQHLLPQLTAHTFDIIYIDASHMYQDVLFDIQQAKRLLVSDGIICGDDLECQLHELNAQEQKEVLLSQKDYALSSFLQRTYHPGVTQAVAEEFGKIISYDGLWAIEYNQGQAHSVDLTHYTLEMPSHIDALPPDSDTYCGYNIVKNHDEYCVIRQSLGKVDISHTKEFLLAHYHPKDVFFSTTISGAQKKIDSFSSPLIETYQGFNICEHGQEYCGIDCQIGPVDLNQTKETLLRCYPSEQLFFFTTLEETKQHIQKLCDTFVQA